MEREELLALLNAVRAGDMPPEEAAVLLLEELLEYYGQWREDCDFRIDAYAVGEQELLDRAAEYRSGTAAG